MDQARLYDLVDFILNSADEQELDVIRSAIRRRENDSSSSGPMGLNLEKMAKESAKHISKQLGASKTQVREMIEGFVKEQIRREAPEISDEQAKELLDAWMPETGERSPDSESAAGPGTKSAAESTAKSDSKPDSAPASKAPGKQLPSDAVLEMVKQFVSFSTGAMTVTEEASLQQSIPDWQKRYWQSFSPTVRRLMSLFLKGAMNGRDFWDGIYDELGLS